MRIIRRLSIYLCAALTLSACTSPSDSTPVTPKDVATVKVISGPSDSLHSLKFACADRANSKALTESSYSVQSMQELKPYSQASSLEEVWGQISRENRYSCEAFYVGADGNIERPEQALSSREQSIADDYMKQQVTGTLGLQAIQMVYEQCASANLGLSGRQAEMASWNRTALLALDRVCPGHPEYGSRRDDLQRNFDRLEREEKAKNKITEGAHRVGTGQGQIPPGDYFAESQDGFAACTWTVFDADGVPMHFSQPTGAFITRVNIAGSAHSFYSRGCGVFTKTN